MNKKETSSYMTNLNKARDFLLNEIASPPIVALVIGSGLAGALKKIEVIKTLEFSQIPFFPLSSVAGHKGQLLYARWNNQSVIILSGRKHCYEGEPSSQVVFPVRVLGGIGVKFLILTNAAGSLNPLIVPGDLMLITDHINLMFRNPLVGHSPEEWGPRFPDMSEPYDRELREIALYSAMERKIPLKQGVYAGLLGPNYETRAEVGFLKTAGADVVGMSTAPENIAAVQMGMRVLGISYVSNSHVMEQKFKTTHDEVIENARLVEEKIISLLEGVLERFADLSHKENL